MYVTERFTLDAQTQDYIHSLLPPFGYNGFGEFIFYRTYSRNIDGFQENWGDCVLRVTAGTFSIRKDWYVKNHIHWNENLWQAYARAFAESMFKMQWMPPGRGLWAMGTDFIYERGSMALQNCGYTNLGRDLGTDISWLMDALMCGVGVGFSPIRDDNLQIYTPIGEYDFEIPDTREGWALSEKLLIDAFIYPGQRLPVYKYNKIRLAGTPIKGFGGIASGPEPLKKLHTETIKQFQLFKTRPQYDSVYLKTNLANLTGCCVVAGNVRRSAELGKEKISDPVFKNLKNYELFPEREAFGWMSNNSVALESDDDFDHLGEIATRVIRNGEPGYINMRNLQYGRIGKDMDGLRFDEAIGLNPCITGESKICLANGQGFVPIKELIGQDVKVYCLDAEDNLVIKTMRNIRKTGENQQIYKIIFDDGNFIRVTGNHKIMLRDRSFVRADELSIDDSVAIFTRTHRKDGYIELYYAAKIYSEHRLIAGATDCWTHVHHIDEDTANNDPENLELKERQKHLEDHSHGSSNPRWSGQSHEDLLQLGIRLCLRLKRRFSTKEWLANNVVGQFSEWRKSEFGSVFLFAHKCAELAGVRNDPVDTRTLRFLQEMLDLGYEADIQDDKVFVFKTCKHCNKEFEINAQRREQACCSLACNNYIRDYTNNLIGQRKTFHEKKISLQEKQLSVFCDLKAKLKKTPLRKEWQEACRDQGISPEIARVGSPFQSWEELRETARSHNHKVAFVIKDGKEDVYNGTVDDFHNYVVGGWEDLSGITKKQRGVYSQNCGEQPLENKELCTLVETLPTMCRNQAEWLQACSFATMYATTVTLLPTHQSSTNRVMCRNRRIGVGIIDYTGWKHEHGVHKVTRYMREGYAEVRRTAKMSNEEAGIPLPIRHTTCKPGGTTPKLPGKTSGVGHPTFDFTLRRVRVAKNSPVHALLMKAGVPYEEDFFDEYTDVFEWPIFQGPAVPAYEVSLWEQAMNLVVVQREWSDNAVANTLYFRPMWALVECITEDVQARLEYYFGIVGASDILLSQRTEAVWPERYKAKIKWDNSNVVEMKVYEYDPRHEEKDVEPVLSAIAPLTKSVSLLPHSSKGAYRQMPEEGISESEYYSRLSQISKIDWSELNNSDGIDDRYCSGPVCEVQLS